MNANALSRPGFPALVLKAAQIMDVILHIGAHRTASTTLQTYLRRNAAGLAEQGVGFWGPMRTRNGGLLSGVLPVPGPVAPDRQFMLARGRIATQCEKTVQKGIHHLVISDENMLGTVRQNLRDSGLYRDAADRLALFAAAFGDRVTRVVVSIRAFDAFWSSSLAYAVGRGHRMPGTDDLDRLVTQPRSWRDIVSEAAAAFPAASLQVQAHETLAGQPDRRLWHMTDGAVQPPRAHARLWLNRAPDLAALRRVLADQGSDPASLPAGEGRWRPFDAMHAAALRETYADDLFWLRAGADGIATLIEEVQPDTLGKNLAGGAKTRGQDDDRQDPGLACAG